MLQLQSDLRLAISESNPREVSETEQVTKTGNSFVSSPTKSPQKKRLKKSVPGTAAGQRFFMARESESGALQAVSEHYEQNFLVQN